MLSFQNGGALCVYLCQLFSSEWDLIPQAEHLGLWEEEVVAKPTGGMDCYCLESAIVVGPT